MPSSVEFTQTRIICKRPLGTRITSGVIAVLFGALCLWPAHYFWPKPAAIVDRSPADILSQFVPILFFPLACLCSLFPYFLSCAGPSELILDTDRRTYRFRRGFPFLAFWRSGPLEDIAGVQIRTVGRESGTESIRGDRSPAYELLLHWRITKGSPWSFLNGHVHSRRPVQLSLSPDLSALRLEAERIAGRITTAVLEQVPSLERERVRAQRLLLLIPVCLYLFLSAVPPLLVSRALDSQGRTVAGVVTDMRHGRDSQAYTVLYSYRVSRHMFQGKSHVSETDYEMMNVGSAVSIRYLPTYPCTSTIADL
jgi:hypothetical protein